MPNAIANCNRLAACGNSAGNRLQPFRIHRLQLLRQRKQRRALPGGNHAEGYSGGAHRADVTRRGSSRLSRWLFPVLQQTSDDRPPMPGKSPPRRGGIYTNGERPFSISRSAQTPTLVANFPPYVVGSPICVSLLQQVAGIDVRIRRDTENGQATDRHRKIKGECAVLNSILGASVQ